MKKLDCGSVLKLILILQYANLDLEPVSIYLFESVHKLTNYVFIKTKVMVIFQQQNTTVPRKNMPTLFY